MDEPGTNDDDPMVDSINLRVSRSFLDGIDEAWRDRGFNNRSEFIRYALREAVNHPEGAGFWRDIAISEAQSNEGARLGSEDVKAKYEHGRE